MHAETNPPGTRAGRLTIAIDGPVASGKSTLGAALAARLGYTYFDSGIVYRALTWLALARGVDVHDEDKLVALAHQMRLEVLPPAVRDGRQFTVLVDGQDATWAIRSREVDRHVSVVSAHPRVRAVLTKRLRALAAGGGVVMVGRDIGTVVLPDADLKVFLTASAEERARRRAAELLARGEPADYEAILRELRERDAIDSGRQAAPLRPADDALLLSSDGRTVEEEVEFILAHLAQKYGDPDSKQAAPERAKTAGAQLTQKRGGQGGEGIAAPDAGNPAGRSKIEDGW